ncbi:hypothetical protein SGPA1_41018 [Streptomyces misionensis JCM 4497]
MRAVFHPVGPAPVPRWHPPGSVGRPAAGLGYGNERFTERSWCHR